MVATSLPFWMQHPSRAMAFHPADSALRLGPSVAATERSSPSRLHRSAKAAGLFIETCDALAVGAYEEAWASLASRALEPNVFLEPGFALPAVRHFPPAQRPGFVLVWRESEGGRAELVGLCALRPPRPAFGLAVSLSWTHPQATLSAPMLDRSLAGEVLAALLGHLAETVADWGGLLLHGVPVDGPLAQLIAGGTLQSTTVERRSRAVLLRRSDPAGADAAGPGAKQAKELRRQARRLGAGAPCRYRSARTVDEVRVATEQFLHMEARGWKGGRGTALLNDAGLAAFTRAMTRQLAKDGRCRIDALETDGRPVAMGIVLQSGDRAFFWKTTYDEDFRRQSPGKQLADRMRAVQLADPAVAVTDSCAVPDHPMIDHVWADRMAVADLLVAGRDVGAHRFARAARLLGLLRLGRRFAKSLVGRMRAPAKGR